MFKGTAASAILYLGLTFLSGTAVGGVGVWLYSKRVVEAAPVQVNRIRSGEFRKRFIDELQARINLRPEQSKKLEGILDATQAVYQELNAKHMPEYDAIQQHQTNQILEMLDAQQKVEFQKFRAERDLTRKQGRKQQPH